VVKEKVMPFKTDEAFTVGGYTHMKMTIRPTPNGQDFTVCQDTGTSRPLVARSFLSHFKDVKITQAEAPAKISGYLGQVTKLKEWATWTATVAMGSHTSPTASGREGSGLPGSEGRDGKTGEEISRTIIPRLGKMASGRSEESFFTVRSGDKWN